MRAPQHRLAQHISSAAFSAMTAMTSAMDATQYSARRALGPRYHGPRASEQGLALVHFSAQLERFVWGVHVGIV